MNVSVNHNDVAAFIWGILPEAEDEAQIVARILDEYDVKPEAAETDTVCFLGKLGQMDIID